MTEEISSHYGTWWAVALWIVMYAAFILFVPFYRKADRKPAGAFLAFIVAFALEMFGLPLTLYFVMWAFGRTLPEGILWGHTLSGLVGDAGVYIATATTIAGAFLIVGGWSRIHDRYWSKEEGKGLLVTDGLYRHLRHPQYTGFLLISLGALCEWATLPLLLLWPVLVVLYVRLARREEAEMADRFGSEWRGYAARTGMFLPRLGAGRRARRGASRTGAVGMVLAFALAVPPAAKAEGFSFKAFAEAGLGLSLSGGAARPLLALDSGLRFGAIEIGSQLAVLPLEFGSPDLVQAGALHYGGTLGATFGATEGVRPFARIGLGGVARQRADANGGFDGGSAEKSFSLSFVAGAAIPLSPRWSLRPWAAWRFAPGARDYEGRSLGGPDFGLALRADWEVELR